MSWVHGVSLNRLYVIDAYNFQIVMSLPAMSLRLTFCASRKGGTGEVGGFQHWAQVTWLLLGLAVESSWSTLGGPFLLLCTNGLSRKAIFLLCRDNHWPRAVAITSLLDSGCGLSHECVQDGCNGT